MAYYVCQPQYITTGTKEQSTQTCGSIYFVTSGSMYDVPLMQTTSIFSHSEKCCAIMFPPFAGQKAKPWKSTDKQSTGEMASALQDKTCFSRLWLNQNIRTKKTISAFMQVDSPLLSVVQTALCYTMYLLPTQLQGSSTFPPSPTTQDVSYFSHLRAPDPHNINFPILYVKISTALQARLTVQVQ